MKKKSGIYTESEAANICILLDIATYEFTHIWIICGMGFALGMTTYIQE